MSYFLATADNFDCLRRLRDDIYKELQTETNFFHNSSSQKAGKREKMLILAVAYLMLLYRVYCLKTC